MQMHLSDHFTYTRVLRFTFPSVIMMVFTSAYGVVDGLFVANFVGKTALAAINFVYPVLIILATLGYMVGTGGSAIVSKTLGEGDREGANRYFSLFVYAAFLLGAVFTLGGYFLLRPLLAFFGAEGEMLTLAVLYGRVMLLAMPFWNLQYLFQVFFVTAEKPALGLYVTLLAGAGNIALDALLVALLDWGLVGAALATATSQILGGAVPLVYFARKNGSLLRLGATRYDARAMKKALSNGMSELFTGISGSLVGILYNMQLIKYSGEDGVAAYSIMLYVSLVFVGIFFGYANGAAPIFGYNYGAKNHRELKSLLRKSLVIYAAGSIFMCLLSEFFAPLLAQIFAGYDPAFYLMTLRGFRIYAVSFLFSGIAIFGSSFFTALNNGPVSAAISFSRTVLFQVGCVLIFPLLWEIDGIWYSVVAAELLSAAVAAGMLVHQRSRYYYG